MNGKDDENRVSRRRFLEAAVVTTVMTRTVESEAVEPDRTDLEKLIEIYGSEIGDVRKVR